MFLWFLLSLLLSFALMLLGDNNTPQAQTQLPVHCLIVADGIPDPDLTAPIRGAHSLPHWGKPWDAPEQVLDIYVHALFSLSQIWHSPAIPMIIHQPVLSDAQRRNPKNNFSRLVHGFLHDRPTTLFENAWYTSALWQIEEDGEDGRHGQSP